MGGMHRLSLFEKNIMMGNCMGCSDQNVREMSGLGQRKGKEWGRGKVRIGAEER